MNLEMESYQDTLTDKFKETKFTVKMKLMATEINQIEL